MYNGQGTVEILQRIEDLCDSHTIVQEHAFGSRDLFWVKVNVTSFYRDGAGYKFHEAGQPAPTWTHASNVRNFSRS